VQIVNKKLLKSVRRPEAAAMASAIRSSLRTVDVQSSGGIFLGKSPAMLINGNRIKRIANKIAFGLFYVIHRYPPPGAYKVTCKFNGGDFSVPDKFIDQFRGFWKTPVAIGENVFTYSYAQCVDDPNIMLLVYWFYDRLWFYGWVLPET
jgi:hypothetical protein